MTKRPNIIFMIADDHRFYDVHTLHNSLVQTPVLDRLAEQGVAFTNTHIMGGQYRAVCTPSRACVLTGGHVFNAVSNLPESRFDEPMSNHTEINPRMAQMPELFKQSGYHTHAIGKWHNDVESFNRGFSGGESLLFGGMAIQDQMPLHAFNPEGTYPREAAVVNDQFSTNIFCDSAIRFIENYDKEEPFLLYMAFTSPHDPRTAPQEYADLYDPQHIPLPKNFMAVHPFDNGEMFVRDEHLACLPRVPAEICKHIADYYAMITHMDAQMGRVIDTLQQKGLSEDTIVVYTSDHGLSVGQHGLMGKQNLYDHSIRIPLIMSGPGLPENVRINALTCQTDIFPTLCELSGISIPQTVDGKSMLSLLSENNDGLYSSVFAIYKDVQRMVKTDSWKLIRYYRSEARETGTDAIQLFNMVDDPWEINNLALNPEQGPVIEEMLQKLRKWQIDLNDPILSQP
ncbi:sulfatase-like hydrolase/transferase [Paenibacillus sp. FSL H8-0034]|uniref:sulfatase-like hydrolase/transferase n=1 Tax=Paenibacillus sp. FSL H8-0034 TaxID=2954671 RepID=UPI0030F7F5F1